MIRPDPRGPTDLRQLTFSEHLIVWTFRAFASGRWECPMVAAAYREGAAGAAGDEAFLRVCELAREIGVGARREITFGRPGLMMVTRDEQLLLAVLAGALQRDGARMAAHLTWLMARTPSEGAVAVGLAAGAALRGTGHWLPPAQADAPDRRSAPGLRAVG